MRSDWRDRLLAYDEPHLDPSERAALERLLDENPEARALLASLRADREVFRQAFATVAARPGFADGVMRRLPAPRRSWFPVPRLLEVCAAGLMMLVIGSLVGPARQLELRRQAACQREVRDLTRVVMSYAHDYDDHLPDARNWVVQVSSHAGASLPARCPSDSRLSLPSYSLPMGLSGADTGRLSEPREQIMLFDAEGPFLAPRHRQGANVSFLDGSVRFVTAEDWARTTGQ